MCAWLWICLLICFFEAGADHGQQQQHQQQDKRRLSASSTGPSISSSSNVVGVGNIHVTVTGTCAVPAGLLLPDGTVIKVVGDGAIQYALHQPTEFTLYASWGNGNPIMDTVFQARLVGPSMVAAMVSRPTGPDKHYRVNYTLHDPGTYHLEIRISWLSGGLMDHLPLPLQGAAFVDRTRHVDCIVYRQLLRTLAPSAKHRPTPIPLPLPLCQGGQHAGRWVWVAPGTDCPPDVCQGTNASLSYLHDLYGFNTNWVWSPYECNYHVFSVAAFEQCLVRKDIRTLGFIGDSLLREHFQNLMVFMQQHINPSRRNNGNKLNDQEFNITLPGGREVNLDYHIRFEDERFETKNQYNDRYINGIRYPSEVHDAQIWNAPLLKLLIQQKPRSMNQPAAMRRWLRGEVHNDLSKFTKPDKAFKSKLARARRRADPTQLPAVYYLHPRIQREDPRIVRNPSVNKVEGYALMTPPRQDEAAQEVLKIFSPYATAGSVTALAAAGLGPLKLLNGLLPTEARWESTWDGAHYTLLVNKFQLIEPVCKKPPYLKGGRNLCHLKQFPGTNRCLNATAVGGGSRVANSNATDVEGRMEFCKSVVDRAARFTHFEGGVSRMLTMMWMNMFCNS